MNKKVVTLISLMSFTMFINNLAHPVTPELVGSIGYGATLIGILFAAMATANFAMSPIWGRLSDHYGRKRFLIIGPIGYSIAQIGFGFSTSPVLIVIFRLIGGGVASASFVAGMAYLIDVSDSATRTKVMATYTALTGFSATIGNFAGGAVGNIDFHYTFVVQSILSLFSALLYLIIIKEPRRHSTAVNKSNLLDILAKYKNTLVPILLIVTILMSFVNLGFKTSFNSYMDIILHFTPFQLGLVLGISGFIGLVMNLFILPLIKRKFNDFHSLVLSIILISVSLMIAMFFIDIEYYVSIGALFLFFAFLAIYRPLLQSMLSKLGKSNGEIMGLNNAANALGMIGGSLISGLIFEENVALAFYFIGFIGVVAFIVLLNKKNNFEELGD